MSSWVSRYNRWVAGPPIWIRVAALIGLAMAAFGLTSKRGLIVGVVATVVYGLISLPALFSSQKVMAWSRQHPVTDGAIFGPLLFLAAAYLSSWPLWICVLVGLAGVALGATLGLRRAHHLALSRNEGEAKKRT